jgi:AAA+ superfamily predicted ATPase
MAEAEVIRVMEAALTADESNLVLRAHLARLLLEDSPAAALPHAQLILQSDPANREALQIAIEAAKATGNSALADGYGKLLDALKWQNAAGMLESPHDPFSDDPDVLPDDDDEDEPERLRAHGEGGKRDDGGLDIEIPKTTLTDVAGMIEVKKRIEIAFLGPMRNPDLRKMYGKSLRGGLLLYGPPGCGKTFIARALAGEMGMKFVNVTLHDMLDAYIGVTENRIHEVFLEARRIQPVILFFDELDALGRKRSLMRESHCRNFVNQILAEMDGIEDQNEGLFTVAATNHPWDIDAALRRPGRFDRVIFVPPPDAPARKAIVQLTLQERPHTGLDLDKIAKETEMFSGADMVHLVESASEFALEDAISRGKARPIGMADFQKALKEVKPSVRPWFDTAKNYAVYANDGGSYDALVQYMKERKML